MVAVRVDELSENQAKPRLRLVEGTSRRVAPRSPVAMKAWLMDDAGTQRGYIVDVSESGARISGTGMRVPVGERLILKFQIHPGEPPIACRAHTIRYHFESGSPELAVQFLDLPFDDWFRLSRVIDGQRQRTREHGLRDRA